ncbi:MAG: ribonuclease HII [Anaerolineae bacterium]
MLPALSLLKEREPVDDDVWEDEAGAAVTRDASKPSPTLDEERGWAAQGYHLVAGIDEVGRGAWAGPVVAAAVILPPEAPDLLERLPGVRDSKLMTPLAREEALPRILDIALAVAVGSAEAQEIDSLGILAATRTAMQRAIEALAVRPQALILDHVTLPLPIPQHSFPRADQTSLSVAAASVVAKVTRDRGMVDLDALYPGYEFARHKGYGTASHMAALERLGPSPTHRASFAPIQAVQLSLGLTQETAKRDPRRGLGRTGEDLAVRALAERGYVVVERNWRCSVGELDIVARHAECLVFVEVRTRRGGWRGAAEDSIGPSKRRKLAALADAYLQAHEASVGTDWRIDVVTVEMDAGGRVRAVEIFEDAVGWR